MLKWNNMLFVWKPDYWLLFFCFISNFLTVLTCSQGRWQYVLRNFVLSERLQNLPMLSKKFIQVPNIRNIITCHDVSCWELKHFGHNNEAKLFHFNKIQLTSEKSVKNNNVRWSLGITCTLEAGLKIVWIRNFYFRDDLWFLQFNMNCN